MNWILDHEPAVRLGAFLGVFAVMALWELVGARRRLSTAKGGRWFANLGITILNTVVVRLLVPTAAVGAAGHEGMMIGLKQFQDARRQTLPWLLTRPFVGRTGEYPVGRDGDG